MKKFAFIVHPRNLDDIYAKYPVFRYLPKFILETILRILPPMRVGKITVNPHVEGEIISIPLTSSQILANPSLASAKIIKALQLAKKRGAQIAGLGALTSSITKGGEDLVGKVDIPITNGNSLTAAVTYEAVKKLAKVHHKDLSKILIAIIGATGSIGRAVTLLLLEGGAQNLLLVGKTTAHLEELHNHIFLHYNKDIPATTDLRRVVQADLLIVSTNAPEAFITQDYLKHGAIVYDITQPQNVSKSVRDSRTDIHVIDGGIVMVPDMESRPTFGLSHHTTFACIAETILLTLEEHFKNFSIGRVNIDDAKELWQLARKHNFTIAPFTSFGEPMR